MSLCLVPCVDFADRYVTSRRTCFQLQYYARLAKTLHPPLYPAPSVISSTTVPPNGQYPVKQLVGRPPRQAGDVVVALSGGAGSASLLDVLVGKGYIGQRADAERSEALERGQKEATWRKAWAVHVDFSRIIPEVRGLTGGRPGCGADMCA